jgi:hypothetical protein
MADRWDRRETPVNRWLDSEGGRVTLRGGGPVRAPWTLALAIACNGGRPERALPGPGDPAADAREPEYTSSGALVQPEDWETWVFLGAALDLSYAPSSGTDDDHVLTTVFLEPTAYAWFAETGTFRDGTMTALVAYRGETDAEPAQQGQFAGDRLAFEMSVKDARLDPDVPWRYYGFGAGGTAVPHDPADCFACHDAHAETDRVFTQFYPVLRAGR